MAIIIPIASGKGGVGKTTLAASLAVYWARRGLNVIALDLDLGGSNLHTALGVLNSGEGLAAYILRHETQLSNLFTPTAWPHLQLVAGDSLIPGMQNIPFYIKKKLFQELSRLETDIILLDLSSGTSTNTLDFFLLSDRGLLVTVPETTAVLNAYSFLKAALFRRLLLQFPKAAPQRLAIEAFMVQKLEGSGRGIGDLIRQWDLPIPENFRPAVVFNQFQDSADFDVAQKLSRICEKNLAISLEDLGTVSREPQARQALNRRIPLVEAFPESLFAQDLARVAQALFPN